MNVDFKREIALRDKLIKELNKSGEMKDKQIADFNEILKSQDKLLESLTTELESAARTLRLQEQLIQTLEKQNEKYKKMINEILSISPELED